MAYYNRNHNFNRQEHRPRNNIPPPSPCYACSREERNLKDGPDGSQTLCSACHSLFSQTELALFKLPTGHLTALRSRGGVPVKTYNFNFDGPFGQKLTWKAASRNPIVIELQDSPPIPPKSVSNGGRNSNIVEPLPPGTTVPQASRYHSNQVGPSMRGTDGSNHPDNYWGTSDRHYNVPNPGAVQGGNVIDRDKSTLNGANNTRRVDTLQGTSTGERERKMENGRIPWKKEYCNQNGLGGNQRHANKKDSAQFKRDVEYARNGRPGIGLRSKPAPLSNAYTGLDSGSRVHDGNRQGNVHSRLGVSGATNQGKNVKSGKSKELNNSRDPRVSRDLRSSITSPRRDERKYAGNDTNYHGKDQRKSPSTEKIDEKERMKREKEQRARDSYRDEQAFCSSAEAARRDPRKESRRHTETRFANSSDYDNKRELSPSRRFESGQRLRKKHASDHVDGGSRKGDHKPINERRGPGRKGEERADVVMSDALVPFRDYIDVKLTRHFSKEGPALDTKRIELLSSMTFSDLLETVKTIFKLTGRVELLYVDQDGDAPMLEEDNDIRLLWKDVKRVQPMILRVKVIATKEEQK